MAIYGNVAEYILNEMTIITCTYKPACLSEQQYFIF